MIIKNLSENNVIASDGRLCTSPYSKFMGLMFTFRQKNSLIFKFKGKSSISLHMLFVFYPIDVLFLNDQKLVVDLKENFMPFTFYKSRKGAMYAIELPKGAIKKSKAKIGDRIGF